MIYTQKQVAQIEREREVVSRELEDLYFTLVTAFAPLLTVGRAQEYVLHGICRRLKIIRRCIDNIFAIIPIERKHFLREEERSDLEINLHAFIINVYGLQDNIAWVYVIEKSLENVVKGGPLGVGLFKETTQCHMPTELREYLNTDPIKSWHERYAKNFRDALAHRIPLYVPPSTMTPKDVQRYQELEIQISEQMKDHDFERTATLMEEQKAIGRICVAFLHSYSDPTSGPIYFHPQIIADANTVMQIVSMVRQHLLLATKSSQIRLGRGACRGSNSG
jgi:hypothetical protein